MQYACNLTTDMNNNNFGRVSCNVTVEDLEDRSIARERKGLFKIVDGRNWPRVLSQRLR